MSKCSLCSRVKIFTTTSLITALDFIIINIVILIIIINMEYAMSSQNEINIPISWELYKHLTNLRQSPDDSYDAVIRRFLTLEERPLANREPYYSYRDVRLPVGAEIRDITYKDKKAQVTENGLLHEGKIYTSPSALAKEIRGYSVNGYTCLEVMQDKDWVSIRKFMKDKNA